MPADDDEEDLFADSDSDDTAELVKKSKAVKEEDDDDKDDLFDSDSEDEKPKPKKALSKREKLEALAKSKRGTTSASRTSSGKSDEKGYESGDSYDSVDIQRTEADDAFLDTTGEDAADVKELYTDQHFDDVRPDKEVKKKKKRGRSGNDDDPGEAPEPDNPIMAAVHRMKKKKQKKASLVELEDSAKTLIGKLEMASDEPLQKLKLLPTLRDEVAKVDLQRTLVDLDLLPVLRKWLEPDANKKLSNVTVRTQVGQCLQRLSGVISSNDLKRSGLGRTIMVLYKHPDETPALKRMWKKLIEDWSRPIFSKSGNMRDRDVRRRSPGQAQGSCSPAAAKQQQDFSKLVTGKRETNEDEIKRVRVPFSKGFQYSVRPAHRSLEPAMPVARTTAAGSRLAKRMVEKGRKVSKNQRSANISVEGRPTK